MAFTLEHFKEIRIRAFNPKDIEYIIKSHRELYEVEQGFYSSFGDYVQDAVNRFSSYYDREKENIWVAELNGEQVGSIAIVKVDDTTSQLRWFLIEPQIRGLGLGHKLMATALEFCQEKNYQHVFLWTVSQLKTARHLYQGYGFSLTQTQANDSWSNQQVTEERWDLSL